MPSGPDLRNSLPDALGQLSPAVDAIETEHARASIRRSLFGESVAIKIDRFIVLEPLGRGGMGTVYLCYDPALDRRVAVKLLQTDKTDRDRQLRLVREAQAQAQLSHPNVVAVHDVGEHESTVFVAMEYIRGQTLRAWIERRPRAWAEIVDVFLQAAEGLAAAHRAGLVHRDFKLDNVMLGDDGRVKVLDFGLARLAQGGQTHRDSGEAALDSAISGPLPDASRGGGPDASRGGGPDASRSAPPASLLAHTVTIEGGRAGTPLYMAPEVRRGEPATARSDQFSYCVALHLALHGVHPFEGSTTAEIADAIANGRIRTRRPASARRVPTWLDRVVQRGLAPDPLARFDSMRRLIDAISRHTARRRRRVFSWVAATGVVAMAAQQGYAAWTSETARCASAGDAIQQVWNDASAEALRRGFVGTERAHAESSFTAVERALQAFADEFVVQRVDACEDTHVRGEQSEELLDRRMNCLEQRRHEFAALVDVLREPSPEVVDRAPQAVTSLEHALRQCSDKQALLAQVAPPASPSEQAEVAAVELELATIRALHWTGQYKPAKARALALLPRAEEVGYTPVLGKAVYMAGSLHERTGDYEAARTSLERAVFLALQARDDHTAADVSSMLVYVTGHHLHRFDEAERWASLAEALFTRVEVDADEHQATLWHHKGSLYSAKGEFERSLDAHRRALEIRERVYGPASAEAANSLGSIAGQLINLQRFEEARTPAERALQIQQTVYGPDHPLVATTLTNLGNVLQALGEHDLALRQLRDALAIRRRAHGSSSPLVATTLFTLGKAEADFGRWDAAAASLSEALEIWQTTLGPTHPNVAAASLSLANVTSERGEFDRAEQDYDRAIAIFVEQRGADHPDTAAAMAGKATLLARRGDPEAGRALLLQAKAILDAKLSPDHPHIALMHTNLGDMALELREYAEAEDRFQKAIAIHEAASSTETPELAESVAGLGHALHGRGRHGPAIEAFERALAIFGASDLPPARAARTEFGLARALWDRNGDGDRTRALELASRAAEGLGQLGDAKRQQEVLAWVDERKSGPR